jgi:hypothetical protein
MGINVSFIEIDGEPFIRYEDDEGAKLWLPQKTAIKSYRSIIGQLRHIIDVSDIQFETVRE